MKNIFLSLAALLMLILPAAAEQLTAEQSLARISTSARGMQHVKRMAASARLCYTERQNNQNLYYVFQQAGGQGYMILGADDVAPAVLAYVPTGSFVKSEQPAPVQAWLSDYESQISTAIRTGRPMFSSAQRAPKAKIENILTTTWGQGSGSGTNAYYNKYCPQYGGKYTPAGCVATAQAQIMKHHRWPLQGTGKNTYTSKTYKFNLSVDFSKYSYNWDAMQDHYGYTYWDDGSTSTVSFFNAANNEVSRLMYHCGVAANMDYDPSGSGTSDADAALGLVNNFGYNPYIARLPREFYTDEEWDDVLYGELSANRPILYCGATQNMAGHAFVFDGYRDGYYHVNWGWDGMANGYYAITGNDPLHPMNQGTGGSALNEGFSIYHTILVNVQPASADLPQDLVLCAYGASNVTNYSSEGENLKNGDYGYVKIYDEDGKESGFYSFTVATVSMRLGLRLTNVETKDVYYLSDPYNDMLTMKFLNGAMAYHVVCEGVPDGVYEAEPAYRINDEGEWLIMRQYAGTKPQRIAYGNATITGDQADATLCCDAVTLEETVSNNRQITATATYVGNSSENDFDGDIVPVIYDAEGKMVARCMAAKMEYQIKAKKYNKADLSFTITVPTEVPDGTYTIRLEAFQKESTNWTPLFRLDTGKGEISLTDIPTATLYVKAPYVSNAPIEIEHLSIADFISRADETHPYEITGTVTAITNTMSRVFNIEENGTSITIYGLVYPDGTNVNLSSINGQKLAKQDRVTLQGYFTKTTTGGRINKAVLIAHEKNAVGIATTDVNVDVNAKYYDLQGRHIMKGAQPHAGMKIIGGKKVLK